MWQFWIDVGGTFTDCIALSPDGSERFNKVLSSGIVKGTLTEASIDHRGWSKVRDPGRTGNTVDFWVDAVFRWFSTEGEAIGEALVQGFAPTTCEIVLDWEHELTPGTRYELDAGLPAPVLAMHLLQGVPIRRPLLDCRVDLGTTRGTNALLTRTGARTALVTSCGFRDFLSIGDQTRPRLFELTVRKPEPLFETAIEINERVLFDGTVEQTPDPVRLAQQLAELKNSGIESLAICLMFGYRYPEHEQQVARVAEQVGFKSIRCSSDVAPVIKIVPRGETTVLDAYLDPVIAAYLNEVQNSLSPASQLRFMTSGGGLVSRARFSGKDSVLSGPAGGVVGAARTAQSVGFDRVIGFDMGGTSTDVARFDGDFERSFETIKAGVRIVTPMLEVETVAAGGGSVCWFDGTRLRVGPQSAGADPGPACYGRNGPLAITDVNLFLGRLRGELFPFQLDGSAVDRRLDELIAEVKAIGMPMTRDQLAVGFWRIANHNMAAAIQTVSVAKGFDPRDYLLLSFGGAGSQHCCGVADNLGLTRILDHSYSSILSAVGIRLADQLAHAVEAVGVLADGVDTETLSDIFSRLETTARELLVVDGNDVSAIELKHSLDLRYQGTELALNIPLLDSQSVAQCLAEFDRLHQQQFGYLQSHRVEIVTARVDATVAGNRLPQLSMPTTFSQRNSDTTQTIWSGDRRIKAAVFNRFDLVAGDQVNGPAVIADAHSTTLVDMGWTARVWPDRILILEKSPLPASVLSPPIQKNSAFRIPHSELQEPDLVQLEIFNNHFSSIARQMGISLQQTSVSVNVKERLDFSCAIFTAIGDLVVNAPHIPVHLGAMSETVRATIELNPDVAAGDVFVTNDPYAGGSHLPDVTVVTPVFDPEGKRLQFWVASRSHHAEIGGSAPGSMPANAQCLLEEGVLIRNFRLLHRSFCQPEPNQNSEIGTRKSEWVDHFDELRQLLTSGRYPSRSPEINLADIRAQVAANQTGVNQLQSLVAKHSFETVEANMRRIQDAAELKTRAALQRLPDGEFCFKDSLDNGATIRVRLDKRGDQLTIDFSGTDPVLPDNLNANPAIVSSAVMYVMRMLIAEDIPLNEGINKPISIALPECFLNPAVPKLTANPATAIESVESIKNRLEAFATECPAIVGGNVETSQRIVDCLLGALGIAAASQGTMNNWLMGDDRFGYYETIGGGAGATATGAGADAVHTHMTNTRLTDPEILETRYGVVLREFAIRRGSGGLGRHRGGDGMIREIEFRQSMTVSLLTGRRTVGPYGMAGGSAGAAGNNRRIHADGRVDPLPSRCEISVAVGDRIRLETPGGGGFGS